MLKIFSAFAADEAGAVTVDWVVLTAALVGLGLAVMTVVRGGVSDLSTDITQNLCGITISTTMADNVVNPQDC
ncbi:MAG: pilus assembly protein [Pseudomonadota bacterium]